MKVVIDRFDLIGDDLTLEVSRGINRNAIRVKVAHNDSSGVDIVVSKQDLIDALKSLI